MEIYIGIINAYAKTSTDNHRLLSLHKLPIDKCIYTDYYHKRCVEYCTNKENSDKLS